VPVAAALAPYDHVLLDLDGCVWVGDAPTPRTGAAVAALREAGKCIAFVTNDGRSSDDDYVRKLWRLGFQASREEVVTVGGALQHVLAESGHRTAFVVGSAAVHRHVADAGLRILNGSDLASRADVVVVAAHDDFDYAELRGAIQAVLRGADLLATARDPTYPQPDGLWPGTGAILAAVEYATARKAEIVGKPEPQLFLTALDRLGEGSTLVIGDRVGSDLAAAAAAELDAALVHSDGSDHDELDGFEPQPVAIGDTLAELLTRT
jgi:HAD superfamily hydrolase (TIGR01450 family)